MADLPPKRLSDDLARVRLVLMRELETISHYEQLAAEADNEELRAFFAHLAYEEKEHVAEATFLLRKLDPGQEAHFQKDFTQAHFEGKAPPAPPPPARPAEPTPAIEPLIGNSTLPPHPQPAKMMYGVPGLTPASAGSLTVGPLKRRGS